MSFELLLIGVVLVFGLIVTMTAVRDSVISEFSDVSGSMQDLNQAVVVNGVTGGASSTAGFDFNDASDIADDADDTTGAADNGVLFDGLPTGELGAPFSASDVSSFGGITFDSGVGGSATGTLGDGTIDTGFLVTTDTGSVSGTVANEVRIRESPGTAGEFTIEFDDAVADLELWIRNLADTGTQNLLGDFTIVLNDGRVFENAAFTVIPDDIQRNSAYGQFNTLSTDTERLSVVTVGGKQYVTDPTSGTSSSQAAGRITFDDLPAYSGTANSNTLGIKSIKFQRSGGTPGYQAAFSISGRAIVPD